MKYVLCRIYEKERCYKLDVLPSAMEAILCTTVQY